MACSADRGEPEKVSAVPMEVSSECESLQLSGRMAVYSIRLLKMKTTTPPSTIVEASCHPKLP